MLWNRKHFASGLWEAGPSYNFGAQVLNFHGSWDVWAFLLSFTLWPYSTGPGENNMAREQTDHHTGAGEEAGLCQFTDNMTVDANAKNLQ